MNLIMFLNGLTFIVTHNIVRCNSDTHLYVIPTPDGFTKVTASIDQSFVLSCVSTGSNEDKPKALKWVSPTNEVISSDLQKRIYTVMQADTLKLYFEKLAPSDSGTYTCLGVEAGAQKEVKANFVLQSKSFNL
jgi:hypothetical protein